MDVAVVLMLVRREEEAWLLHDPKDQDRPWVLSGGASVDWDEWCGASGGRLAGGSAHDGLGSGVLDRLLDRQWVLVGSGGEEGCGGDGDDGATCNWASRRVGGLVQGSSCSEEWSMLGKSWYWW